MIRHTVSCQTRTYSFYMPLALCVSLWYWRCCWLDDGKGIRPVKVPHSNYNYQKITFVDHDRPWVTLDKRAGRHWIVTINTACHWYRHHCSVTKWICWAVNVLVNRITMVIVGDENVTWCLRPSCHSRWIMLSSNWHFSGSKKDVRLTLVGGWVLSPTTDAVLYGWLLEMVSLRPWPWTRGTSRTTRRVLGLERRRSCYAFRCRMYTETFFCSVVSAVRCNCERWYVLSFWLNINTQDRASVLSCLWPCRHSLWPWSWKSSLEVESLTLIPCLHVLHIAMR